jgi:hypothetical protein
VAWTRIRVTYRDVLELVLAEAIPREDVLVPQCHVATGSAYRRQSNGKAATGHQIGCFWVSPVGLVAGIHKWLVVHKPLPTAAYRPTLSYPFLRTVAYILREVARAGGRGK